MSTVCLQCILSLLLPLRACRPTSHPKNDDIQPESAAKSAARRVDFTSLSPLAHRSCKWIAVFLERVSLMEGALTSFGSMVVTVLCQLRRVHDEAVIRSLTSLQPCFLALEWFLRIIFGMSGFKETMSRDEGFNTTIPTILPVHEPVASHIPLKG